MRRLWDDNLNKYVDVFDYKIVITLDIPDEVMSDDNNTVRANHDVRMKKITLCYPSKEAMDKQYESFVMQFCKGDGVRLVQVQDRAIITNHIVMVELVSHVDLGPIEESDRPRFKLINGRIKRYGNFDEDWIDIEIRVDIWMKCRFRVVE